MSRVFLSHAREDQPFATRLKRALSARGAETLDPARAANSDVATALGETRYPEDDSELDDWAGRVLAELKAA